MKRLSEKEIEEQFRKGHRRGAIVLAAVVALITSPLLILAFATGSGFLIGFLAILYAFVWVLWKMTGS